MKSPRQDVWTEKDDSLLAEIVLRNISDGGTQLSAFEQVGKKLGRTPAACGFRWNSMIRKNYSYEISLAKEKRKSKTGSSKGIITNSTDTISQYMNNHTELPKEISDLNTAIEVLNNSTGRLIELLKIESQYADLQYKYEELLRRLEEYVEMEKDFEMLKDIVSKPRRSNTNKDLIYVSASVS